MSDDVRVFGQSAKLSVVPNTALELVEITEWGMPGVTATRYLMPEDAQRLRDRLDAALVELGSDAGGTVAVAIPGCLPAEERCQPGAYSTDFKGKRYAVKYSVGGSPIFEGRPGHWWWSMSAAVQDRQRYEDKAAGVDPA